MHQEATSEETASKLSGKMYRQGVFTFCDNGRFSIPVRVGPSSLLLLCIRLHDDTGMRISIWYNYRNEPIPRMRFWTTSCKRIECFHPRDQ